MSIGRRRFLVGASGASLALPTLLSRPGHAQSTPPKRLVLFFTPCGVQQEQWFPTGGERDFVLGPTHAPLAPHREDLVLTKGIDLAVRTTSRGDSHHRGMAMVLTGREILPGDDTGSTGLAGGISVDQVIANAIGGATPFASYQFGVKTRWDGRVFDYASWAAAGRPKPSNDDPAAAFRDLFGEPSPRRRHVLDAVREELRRLRATLDGADRNKLDVHLASIESVQARTQRSCDPPAMPIAEDFGAIGRAQTDLLVRALACDLTRVATLQWSTGVSHQAFPWLGVNDSHHDTTHSPESIEDRTGKLLAIEHWYAEQFAYLLDQLEQVPEGEGTLLDHTLVVWFNELSFSAHGTTDMPFVLAGRCGGALETGRFLQFDRKKHNDLLVTVLNLMGQEVSTFGDPELCDGPLPL